MKNDNRDDLLQRIAWSLVSVIVILGLSFAVVLFLRQVLKIPFSNWLNFWLAVWILSLFIFLWLIRKQRFAPVVQKSHFIFFIFQIFILTIILHYIGGIESSGILFYTFFIVYGIFLFPKRYSLFIVLISFLFLATLSFLEYNDALSHYDIFLGQQSYKNPKFVFIRLLIATTTFSLLVIIANRLSEKMKLQSKNLLRAQGGFKEANLELKRKLEELEVVRGDLEETKATLEIKVKARTEELESLTENLEEEVEQRTKELQDKVQELEKFQEFIVGREAKMIELKKEIEGLKKELGKK